MNGEPMYALKPLVSRNLTKISDGNCMYAMKNIHGICLRDDHASKFCNNVTDISEQNPLTEVAILEARQEKILAQLAELREQVLCLCDVLKTNDSQKASGSTKLRDPTVVDLIVNANPRKPCWTILALSNLWTDVNFNVKTYRHSSVEGPIPEFVVCCRTDYRDTVNVDLIWKEVEDMETIVPESRGFPIIGESNFLRYLVRRLFEKNYENSANDREIGTMENLLDMSYRLHYEKSSKDTHTILGKLGEILGKKNWLFSDKSAGIIDIAAWSAIKQASLPKIPNNVSSWFGRCENTFLK